MSDRAFPPVPERVRGIISNDAIERLAGAGVLLVDVPPRVVDLMRQGVSIDPRRGLNGAEEPERASDSKLEHLARRVAAARANVAAAERRFIEARAAMETARTELHADREALGEAETALIVFARGDEKRGPV